MYIMSYGYIHVYREIVLAMPWVYADLATCRYLSINVNIDLQGLQEALQVQGIPSYRANPFVHCHREYLGLLGDRPCREIPSDLGYRALQAYQKHRGDPIVVKEEDSNG